MADRRQLLPTWLKLAAALFTAALAAAYAPHYGLVNFLWFSNIALLLVTLGILLESPLLISMAAVGVLVPELAWSADFLGRLVAGRPVLGITEYFWTGDRPPWVRALTLYHLALPPGLWWLTGRLGYDRRALVAWCVVAFCAAAIVLAVGDPVRNVNRLWGLGAGPQAGVPRPLYLLAWAVIVPLGIWWPTHRLLLWRAARRQPPTPAP